MPALKEYASGYLQVDSDEPGSYIMMYGKDTGDKTPTVYQAVPIGNRNITVISTSGETKTETVMILPGIMDTLHVNFSS